MSEPKIPNEVYKKAAELLDKFPGVDFMNIVRLLVIGRESNAPKSAYLPLGLDDDPEQATESKPEREYVTAYPRNIEPIIPTKLDPEKPKDVVRELKRRGRPRRIQITFKDGKTFAYPSRRDLLIMNGFTSALFDVVFPHNIKDADKYLQFEANKVSDLFANLGKPLSEYVCYDFDGKRRAFTFHNESEAVNA